MKRNIIRLYKTGIAGLRRLRRYAEAAGNEKL